MSIITMGADRSPEQKLYEGADVSETPNPAAAKGAGLSIAGLILGAVAFVVALIPLFGIGLVWVPALLALIFGIIGLTGGRPKKVLAIIAVALSVISVIVAIVTFTAGVAGVAKSVEEATATEPAEVVYEITGDGGSANVSYSSWADGEFGSQSANGAPLPWSQTETIEVAKNSTFDFTSLTLSATGNEATTTLTCKITVDGEVVSENTSTGAYALVMCSQSGS